MPSSSVQKSSPGPEWELEYLSSKWVNERGADNISQLIVSVKDCIPFLWLPQQITTPQVA